MRCFYKAGKFLLIVGFMFMMLSAGSSSADISADSPIKILLKIKNIDDTLNAIDGLTGSGPQPTAMLRGLIQGTDWIDADRTIVLGVDLSGEIPSASLLIPYVYENENFQSSFNALVRNDYYLMGLPPGGSTTISEKAEQTLVLASAGSPNNAISVEIAVADLLNDSRELVDSLVGAMEQKMSNLPAGSAPPAEFDMKNTVDGMVNTFGQLKSLTLGIDISSDELNFATEALADSGTELSRLFSKVGTTSRFSHYTPQGHMTYKTRSLDIETMMGLIESAFGKTYEAFGINFAELSDIATYFTGESAGGISYEKDGMKMEMVHVLKNEPESDDFLETVYLPWMRNYGTTMRQIYKDGTGSDPGEIFTRMSDIAIDGHKVYRANLRFYAGAAPRAEGTSVEPKMTESVLYIADIGDLLLTAPNQNRMADLITVAKLSTAQPDTGPLMVSEMDMDGYLQFIREMVPDSGNALANLPPFGKVSTTVHMQGGRAYTSTRLKTDFIKKLITMSKEQANVSTAAATAKPVAPRPMQEPGTVNTSNVDEPVIKDAEYWIDKGNLVATYGNDKAAIRYYQEALKKDPMNPSAHFNMGVSYGELGGYSMALGSINRAIELNPSNSNYFYGRGRVYLLAGDEVKADKDFRIAADMGNSDAEGYLKLKGE